MKYVVGVILVLAVLASLIFLSKKMEAEHKAIDLAYQDTLRQIRSRTLQLQRDSARLAVKADQLYTAWRSAHDSVLREGILALTYKHRYDKLRKAAAPLLSDSAIASELERLYPR